MTVATQRIVDEPFAPLIPVAVIFEEQRSFVEALILTEDIAVTLERLVKNAVALTNLLPVAVIEHLSCRLADPKQIFLPFAMTLETQESVDDPGFVIRADPIIALLQSKVVDALCATFPVQVIVELQVNVAVPITLRIAFKVDSHRNDDDA